MTKKVARKLAIKFTTKHKSAHKKLSLLASSMIVLAAQSSAAVAGLDWCDWHPYIGADVAWRHQGVQSNFGGNQVRKDAPQGDIYGGLKLCDYLGVQLGYEATTSRRRSSYVLGNEIAFGTIIHPEIPNGVTQFVTTSQIYGWHADVVGFLPFCVCENRFDLVGSIGIAKLRYKAKFYNTIQDSIPLPPGEISNTYRTFSNSKYVPRIGLGLQYMLTECAGIRLIGTWENTSRIRKFRAPVENSQSQGQVSLRNAITLGLGVFYNF